MSGWARENRCRAGGHVWVIAWPDTRVLTCSHVYWCVDKCCMTSDESWECGTHCYIKDTPEHSIYCRSLHYTGYTRLQSVSDFTFPLSFSQVFPAEYNLKTQLSSTYSWLENFFVLLSWGLGVDRWMKVWIWSIRVVTLGWSCSDNLWLLTRATCFRSMDNNQKK